MDKDIPAFLNDELLSQPEPAMAGTGPAEPAPDTEGFASAGIAPGASHAGAFHAHAQAAEPHRVPLAAMLDTRDKLKEQQAENTALKRQLEALAQEEARRSPGEMPSSRDIPPEAFEAYRAALMDEVQGTIGTHLLGANLTAAEQRHGEAFTTAFATIVNAGDPLLVQQLLAQPDPGEAIVRWHRRMQAIARIPEAAYGDLDGWVRQRYAELAAEAAGRAAAPGRQLHPAAPPPSLAAAPGSAGAFRETVPESAFAYAFGG